MEHLDLGFKDEYVNWCFSKSLKEKWPQINEKTSVCIVNSHTFKVGISFTSGTDAINSQVKSYTDFKKGFKNYLKRIMGCVIDAHRLRYQWM